MKARNELQQEYIDWFVDGCDIKTLCAIVAHQMKDDLDMLDDDELLSEVKDYAPDLLEDAHS